MRQVVIAGPERRRRWAEEERLSILTEAFAPGACVADVARRRDVSTSLIYTWRRRFLEANGEPAPDETPPGFAEAVMIEDGAAASSSAVPAIVVDLARGRRVSIFASASPAQVTAVLKALR
jgi:Transposase and inactivated derivatives